MSFSAKQKQQIRKNIRTLKTRAFPERGGGRELAVRLGISPQLLSNWLNGRRTPSPLHLAKLARVFDVSIQDLCALPHAKCRVSAWELILDLTKLRERSRKKSKNPHDERKRLKELNMLICKGLH